MLCALIYEEASLALLPSHVHASRVSCLVAGLTDMLPVYRVGQLVC